MNSNINKIKEFNKTTKTKKDHCCKLFELLKLIHSLDDSLNDERLLCGFINYQTMFYNWIDKGIPTTKKELDHILNYAIAELKNKATLY